MTTEEGPSVSDADDHLQHLELGLLHRLVFVSDGVFAIALTLLALEIRAPKGWDGGAYSLWIGLWPTFLAYGASFASIAVYWASHRRSFSRFARADGWLTALNFLMLALVALIPPATQMVYETGRKGDAMVLYAALIASAGVAHGLMWIYAAFIGRLLNTHLSIALRIWVAVVSSLLPGTMCALGLYVGVSHAWWAMMLLVVLPPLTGFSRGWIARRDRRRSLA